MNRRLFVPNEDVLDLVVLEQGVIDRKHGTAGVAEYNLDTLVLKRLQQKFCSRHHRCGCGRAGPCVFCRRCGFGHRPVPCFVTSRRFVTSGLYAVVNLSVLSGRFPVTRTPFTSDKRLGAHRRFGRCDPCAGLNCETLGRNRNSHQCGVYIAENEEWSTLF